MSSSPPIFEEMTIGMLLDRSFRLFFDNFGLLFLIMALPYSPFVIYGAVLSAYPQLLLKEDQVLGQVPSSVALTSVFLLGIFFYVFVFPLVTGAVTHLVSNRYLGRPASWKKSFRATFSRIWTLIWCQFVVGLLVLIGLMCLIIPGIFVWIGFSLLVPVVILEGGDPSDSRSRAWNLSSFYRWKIFFVILVMFIIQGVVPFGLGMATPLLPANTAIQVALDLISSLWRIALSPLGIVAIVLLYYDIRIRKEGFDLEMLAASMDGGDRGDPDSLSPEPSM